ncbi:hypothetical protein [Pseudidiomarina sp.]|uniref:hypothetical protein n=1 Tax=Pseudidiomarina sp. TaxID=2081707 RepID=UPI00299D0487|nr:hypothetical protein [Pseudidiomarina sp.]MDX1705574.1 hypothetical protein [Pseudidiomarina sp.]
MSWAKLSMMALSAWLLVGCTAAELDAFNDSLRCVNEFPNDTYRQNQCISYMNEARETEQHNALYDWCQAYAIRPIQAASPKLDRDIEAFDRKFESLRSRVEQVADYYGDYCNTPQQRRANSNCQYQQMQGFLNEFNALQVEVARLQPEEARVNNLFTTFNNECLGLDGAQYMPYSSNAPYLADRRAFLEGAAAELRAYLANW